MSMHRVSQFEKMCFLHVFAGLRQDEKDPFVRDTVITLPLLYRLVSAIEHRTNPIPG